MDRSDSFQYGLLLVGIALSYFLGGTGGALLCLFIGVVLIVVYHMGKAKDDDDFRLWPSGATSSTEKAASNRAEVFLESPKFGTTEPPSPDLDRPETDYLRKLANDEKRVLSKFVSDNIRCTTSFIHNVPLQITADRLIAVGLLEAIPAPPGGQKLSDHAWCIKTQVFDYLKEHPELLKVKEIE